MRPEVQLVREIVVIGTPAPGGNKNGFPIYKGSKAKGTREFTGRVVVAEQNKKVKPWREQVERAAHGGESLSSRATPLDEPLVVQYRFTLAKPATVSLQHRPYPSVKPDNDKLVRATQDALTDAGVWCDDARIVGTLISKAYVGGFHPDGTPAMAVPGCAVVIFRVMSPCT